jgi:hypothetical protein
LGQKPRQVASGDLQIKAAGAVRDVFDRWALGGFVGKGTGTDNRPVQSASFDQLFLQFVIAEDRCQKGAEHDPLPPEVQGRPTVAGPKGGLGDQAADTSGMHRLDHIHCALRADPAFPGHACAKCHDSGLLPFHCGRNIRQLHRITRNKAQVRTSQPQLFRRARKSGHPMPSFQQFCHSQTSNCACRTKYNHIHRRSPFRSAPAIT